jgi:PKD repeat protein
MIRVSTLFTFIVMFCANHICACTDSYSSITDTVCNFYLSPSEKYNWFESGTYLDTIPNMSGCDSIITLELTIEQGPIVHFSVSNVKGCSPVIASYTNQTNGDNLTFIWNFGDGTTSQNVEQHVHVYTAPGTYDVSLTATSEFGCSATRIASDFIQVYPDPIISVDLLVDNCEKEVSISISPDGVDNARWTLPDNTGISGGYSIASNQEGTYRIDVYSNYGCYSYDTLVVKFNFCEKPGGIKLFPNPSSGVIHINNLQPNSTVKVIALNGHVYDVGITDENGELVVDLRFLPEGIYYLQINTDGNFRYKKVLIIRPN